MSEDIKGLNYWSNILGMIGWLASLAYYNWFSANPPHVPLWGHLLMIAGGCFLLTTLITAVLAATAWSVTQRRKGYGSASLTPFVVVTLSSPLMAFFAAKGALWLFSAL